MGILLNFKGQFHRSTKHADERQNMADDQKKLIGGSKLQFIFALYCGQRLDTDRSIEIDIFGWSERLVWPTK